ncbi:hypothetical protein QP181_16830 [Sphingomonas sp. LR55]
MTPTPSLIAAARDLPIPVHMLVRPREGAFGTAHARRH